MRFCHLTQVSRVIFYQFFLSLAVHVPIIFHFVIVPIVIVKLNVTHIKFRLPHVLHWQVSRYNLAFFILKELKSDNLRIFFWGGVKEKGGRLEG